MSFAAININYDSLAEVYGFPENYEDPSYGVVQERFLRFAQDYGFKYSTYLIDKDGEYNFSRKGMKLYAEEGHEIGNHTWSHPLSLGSLSYDRVKDEIEKSHKALFEITGVEPKGFIAPGWSNSSRVQSVLKEMSYSYDTSSFPTLLLYPSIAKMLLNHFGSPTFKNILMRKDWFNPLLGRRAPFVKDGLVTMPLPTAKFRMACWHTTAFVFGWKRHEALLRDCLKRYKYFYYLVHPADLLAPQDLDRTRGCSLERSQISIETKLDYFRRALDVICESGKRLIRMDEMADLIRNETV
ncbi:polysaccharide deacetylase family protein [Limisalsivibrio acetivorans]|uniref:polysaccharide deacetylase family protein n=1 Tax=Limisalsivibrio acetivorans TaxID=1304888 RepID=UPI0003B6FAA5|nr:polysaccharide deacetylase family protein [Limisalsivibrio acetivorans]